jgi:hypothetical protein
MKKLVALLLVLGLASAASATVIDVVPVDVGQSGGRLGGMDDPLEASDVIGLKIVLNHNPYVGYPSYDGYILSSMDLDLHIAGPASLDVGTRNKAGDPVWQFDPGLTGVVNDDDGLANGLNQITAVAFTPVGGTNYHPDDLMWDLLLHCDGPGEVIIDLTLLGLTEYADYSDGQGLAPYPAGAWKAAIEEDLGDLVIYQVPEPMTIGLLGLGGLLLRRRK